MTKHILEGENALGAVLANGWYAGYIGFVPPHLRPMENHGLYGDVPGLLLQLELTYADGRKKIVKTDSTWRATTGPIRSTDMQMGEIYDARRELLGWKEPGFKDLSWRQVQLLDTNKVLILQSYPGNPVRKQQSIVPVSISVGAAHFLACSIIAEKSFAPPSGLSPMCENPGKPAAPVVYTRSP